MSVHQQQLSHLVTPGFPQTPQTLQPSGLCSGWDLPVVPVHVCSMQGTLAASWGCVQVSLGRCFPKLGETPGEEGSGQPPLWSLRGRRVGVSQSESPCESRVTAVPVGCSLCPLSVCPALQPAPTARGEVTGSRGADCCCLQVCRASLESVPCQESWLGSSPAPADPGPGQTLGRQLHICPSLGRSFHLPMGPPPEGAWSCLRSHVGTVEGTSVGLAALSLLIRVEKKERARLKTVKFHARTGMIESNRVSADLGLSGAPGAGN